MHISMLLVADKDPFRSSKCVSPTNRTRVQFGPFLGDAFVVSFADDRLLYLFYYCFFPAGELKEGGAGDEQMLEGLARRQRAPSRERKGVQKITREGEAQFFFFIFHAPLFVCRRPARRFA